ncbi:hypothetical protein E4U54_004398, partial [Claviceps lovelessii]
MERGEVNSSSSGGGSGSGSGSSLTDGRARRPGQPEQPEQPEQRTLNSAAQAKRGGRADGSAKPWMDPRTRAMRPRGTDRRV